MKLQPLCDLALKWLTVTICLSFLFLLIRLANITSRPPQQEEFVGPQSCWRGGTTYTILCIQTVKLKLFQTHSFSLPYSRIAEHWVLHLSLCQHTCPLQAIDPSPKSTLFYISFHQHIVLLLIADHFHLIMCCHAIKALVTCKSITPPLVWKEEIALWYVSAIAELTLPKVCFREGQHASLKTCFWVILKALAPSLLMCKETCNAS